MRFRVTMIVSAPDYYDYGDVEQFIEDAIMILAINKKTAVDIKGFIDIDEV